MVHSPNGYTDFFTIVKGVLQADTFAPFLFIICLDYVLRMLKYLKKESGLTFEKKRQEADDISKKLLLIQIAHII